MKLKKNIHKSIDYLKSLRGRLYGEFQFQPDKFQSGLEMNEKISARAGITIKSTKKPVLVS